MSVKVRDLSTRPVSEDIESNRFVVSTGGQEGLIFSRLDITFMKFMKSLQLSVERIQCSTVLWPCVSSWACFYFPLLAVNSLWF